MSDTNFVNFSSVKRLKDSKERDLFRFYMTKEDAESFAAYLVDAVDEQPKGLRLDIHVGTTGEQKYETAFGTVSPKMDQKQSTKKVVKPKATREQLAKVKERLSAQG